MHQVNLGRGHMMHLIFYGVNETKVDEVAAILLVQKFCA